MKKGSYTATENNGGGIALYCRDISGNEFARNGYEYNDKQLFEDLRDFFEKGDVGQWDNNDLQNEEMINFYAESQGEDPETNEDGNLIPIDLDVWANEQDHDTTKTILSGDILQMTVQLSNCGHNASKIIQYIYLLFDLENDCPNIDIIK